MDLHQDFCGHSQRLSPFHPILRVQYPQQSSIVSYYATARHVAAADSTAIDITPEDHLSASTGTATEYWLWLVRKPTKNWQKLKRWCRSWLHKHLYWKRQCSSEITTSGKESRCEIERRERYEIDRKQQLKWKARAGRGSKGCSYSSTRRGESEGRCNFNSQNIRISK